MFSFSKKKKLFFGETSSHFIQQSLGLRLPMYIYMKLSTENIKLNLHVHGLLYLIIYIRTSKLKPKLIPQESICFFKIETNNGKMRCQFV